MKVQCIYWLFIRFTNLINVRNMEYINIICNLVCDILTYDAVCFYTHFKGFLINC